MRKSSTAPPSLPLAVFSGHWSMVHSISDESGRGGQRGRGGRDMSRNKGRGDWPRTAGKACASPQFWSLVNGLCCLGHWSMVPGLLMPSNLCGPQKLGLQMFHKQRASHKPRTVGHTIRQMKHMALPISCHSLCFQCHSLCIRAAICHDTFGKWQK